MSPTRPCPVCLSRQIGARLTINEHIFGLPEAFAYFTCDSCGSLFIEAVPDDLGRYYDASAYYSFDDDPAVTMGQPGIREAIGTVGRLILLGPQPGVVARAAILGPRSVRTLVSILSSVRRAGLPRGRATRILDVGAGSGTLVYALDLAGLHHVTGIDPFLSADGPVARRGQLLCRHLEDVEGEFDLVMFHHSLEHVPDPGRTLSLAMERLSPEGHVLVRMPTVSSAAYERYGTAWIGCDAPRHLTIPSRKGMESLCAKSGYQIVSVVDDSNESQFWASEQNDSNITLAAKNSHFVNPQRSPFSRAQIRAWRREARQLNRRGRGDQAAWVLAPRRPVPSLSA